MSNEAKKPAFIAYTVRDNGLDGDAKKSYWDRVGAAWTNKSGEGLSLDLSAFPVNGRIVLMPPKQDDEAA